VVAGKTEPWREIWLQGKRLGAAEPFPPCPHYNELRKRESWFR